MAPGITDSKTDKTKRLLRAAALASLLLLSTGAIPAQAKQQGAKFKGYFAPCHLVSPLRDDLVYTPVGMGRITSNAGYRVHPVTHKHSFHSGVDLAAKLNDRVYNLLDGIVTRVGWRGNLGCAVEVYHPYPNVKTICGHLNAYSVMPGMWVQRGQVLGYAGSTGRSTGVHLHYTVIRADTKDYIEPLEFLKLVPNYVSALKTARIQAGAQQRLKEMQDVAKEPIDTDDEDLPGDPEHS